MGRFGITCVEPTYSLVDYMVEKIVSDEWDHNTMVTHTHARDLEALMPQERGSEEV